MGQKANYYALTIDYTQTATGGDTCPFPAVANMFFVSIGESEKTFNSSLLRVLILNYTASPIQV